MYDAIWYNDFNDKLKTDKYIVCVYSKALNQSKINE